MNICLISPLPPPTGGIATWTQKFLNSPISKENKIILIDNSVVGKRKRVYSNKFNLLNEVYRSSIILIKLLRKLKTDNIDIVHINTSCGKLGVIRDFLCAKLTKIFKTKVVIHCHCDVSKKLINKVQRKFFKKMIFHSDFVLTLNVPSKNYIKQNYSKESLILPNFLTQSELNINKICIRPQIKNILFVGHVTYNKGVYEIFELAKLIPHINFYLAGIVMDDNINKDKLVENVILLGQISIDEVKKYMDICDLFLFPTHTEGFPNVIIEAMSKGMPIVSTNVGAIPEILEDKGGILVEPTKIEQILNAIYVLYDNIQERNNMSIFNFQKVRNDYSEDTVLKTLIDVYKNLKKVNKLNE